MAELKTKKTEESVEAFLNSIPDENKRRDSFTILEMMKQVSGAEPRMWGTSIVGFGDEHYRYASGKEGDWFQVGFSPRKQNLTLYLTYGFERHEELLKRLGKHKIGKACLYINRLEEIQFDVLRELVEVSIREKGNPS